MSTIKQVLGAASVGCLATLTLTPAATATDPDPVVKQAQVLDGAPCGSFPINDHDPKEKSHAKEVAYLRSGSGPSCPRVQRVTPDTSLDPYCWVYAPSNGNFWDYMNPAGSGKTSGWLNEDHLRPDDWSTVECPWDIARPAFLR